MRLGSKLNDEKFCPYDIFLKLSKSDESDLDY